MNPKKSTEGHFGASVVVNFQRANKTLSSPRKLQISDFQLRPPPPLQGQKGPVRVLPRMSPTKLCCCPRGKQLFLGVGVSSTIPCSAMRNPNKKLLCFFQVPEKTAAFLVKLKTSPAGSCNPEKARCTGWGFGPRDVPALKDAELSARLTASVKGSVHFLDATLIC
jgi:hypothetical protein